MDSELTEFKEELHLDIDVGSALDNSFPEESFFDVATQRLSEAGILDNVEPALFKDTNKGLRLDGYCWNDLERTLCLLVVHLSADPTELDRLTQTELKSVARRPLRFLEHISKDNFVKSLDPASDGYLAATYFNSLSDSVVKYKIVLLSDYVLSDRVKTIHSETIRGIPASIEVWDLQRFFALETATSDTEPFTVDKELLNGGLHVIQGAQLPDGASSYLGVMPASTLSKIYDEFGQRLLEGNVRTFLDFRGGVNKGLRRTLVLEPENFFAYNNGITLTADAAEVESKDGVHFITSLENLQIVNGGQTTAALYFAPKENGAIKTAQGDKPYKSIDLDKVSIQMKLTVFSGEDKEQADLYRSNISNFANSQNSVQASDLVSNHPFHLAIERLSRQIIMPAGDSGLSTKWFYERTRGQYSTKLRALSTAGKNKFLLEFPKGQLFTKTDLAKYENTWRMVPHVVKKGAQANLKLLGPILANEFSENPSDFEAAYYKDLIAKVILFRDVDKAVMRSSWYQQEKGLKAEAVTFAIALVRYKLLEIKRDINLERVFANQALSSSLLYCIVNAAKAVRTSISDPVFRGGTGNPSEFCKSESGWKKIKTLDVNISVLSAGDSLSIEQKKDQEEEKKEVNRASKSVADIQSIMELGYGYWTELVKFNSQFYHHNELQVAIPMKCAQMLKGGKLLSDKQIKAAVRIKDQAIDKGFEFS